MPVSVPVFLYSTCSLRECGSHVSYLSLAPHKQWQLRQDKTQDIFGRKVESNIKQHYHQHHGRPNAQAVSMKLVRPRIHASRLSYASLLLASPRHNVTCLAALLTATRLCNHTRQFERFIFNKTRRPSDVSAFAHLTSCSSQFHQRLVNRPSVLARQTD